MKKKLISILFLLMLFFQNSVSASQIDKNISKLGLETHATVAIEAKDLNSGEVLYKKHEKKLLNPASTLKLLTFGASYLTLGKGYNFETALYIDKDNNIYVKLGADTLLSQSDLKNLFSQLKTKIDINIIKNIYIDDSIIDKTPYPLGWMEEDIWPYSRAITPYIIDKNYFDVVIKRSSLATKVDIIQNSSYKLAIINELKLGGVQNVQISRLFGENSPIVTFSGTVSKDEIKKVPVLSPEINFNIKLREAIDANKIDYFNKITNKKTPKNAKKIALVSHSIEEISKDILHNSDNFSSEVVFRTAAAKHIKYSRPASLKDAILMFQEVFPLDEGITIADASGVSRHNLLNCDFINRTLTILLKDEDFKNLLMSPNQGTLKDRLLFLDNNLKAKTGTLANLSSIAGVLKSKRQRDIVFSVIIQNSTKRKALLKAFEDIVITELYRKY